MDDNKHPSPNATYLAACIFFSTITGESPLGLPKRFEVKNIDVKKISPNFVLALINKWKNYGWYPKNVKISRGQILEKKLA